MYKFCTEIRGCIYLKVDFNCVPLCFVCVCVYFILYCVLAKHLYIYMFLALYLPINTLNPCALFQRFVPNNHQQGLLMTPFEIKFLHQILAFNLCRTKLIKIGTGDKHQALENICMLLKVAKYVPTNIFWYSNPSRSICDCNDRRPRFRGLRHQARSSAATLLNMRKRDFLVSLPMNLNQPRCYCVNLGRILQTKIS